MESYHRGRRKKLIRALEIGRANRHGRPTCGECTEALKRKRGCKKPGESYEMEGTPYAYTSPALLEAGEASQGECPVGYVLRESPQTYELLSRCGCAESMSPNEMARLPQYTQDAIRIYRSECERIRILNDSNKSASDDAKHAAQMVRRR